jgi:Phage gp6-like head-tail connector protein
VSTTSDLATLASVKRFLVITTTNQDELLSNLIATESQAIEGYCVRSFAREVRTGVVLDGSGSSVLVLPDTPIVSVQSLSVGGKAVPASDGPSSYGYQFDESALYLVGDKFPYQRRAVEASWTAGYVGETTAVVPAGNAPTITPSGTAVKGGWAREDLGVDYNGLVLERVTGAPATALQYSFSDGVYTFNSGAAGYSLTLAFSFVPGPVMQACIEMVGLDLKQRDSLGVKSRGIAGESVTYETGGMTTSVKHLLAPYLRKAPL